jgi:hypothetical protein
MTMTIPSNLFADFPQRLPEEMVTTLLEAANVRIERIVSHGHASPEGFWCDQDQHEWVVVLKGAARLRFEDGEAVAPKPKQMSRCVKPNQGLSRPGEQAD